MKAVSLCKMKGKHGDISKNGWITWDFTPFKTQFHSYMIDVRVIMKGYMHLYLVYVIV